jgi:hypothetical protein
VRPKQPKVQPQLSQDALEGKSVLSGFDQLKAFFEAKKKDKPKEGEAGSAPENA